MATFAIKVRGIETLIEVTGNPDEYDWYVPGNELLTLLLKENNEMEVCDGINEQIDNFKADNEIEYQLSEIGAAA